MSNDSLGPRLALMAVLDASVVIDWVAPGVDLGGPAGRLLDGLAERGESLRAPALLGPEVADALVTGVEDVVLVG
jgi:hypothetical protein